MAVYERRDGDGRVVERAFVPSARPSRDAQVREWAMAGLHGWGDAEQKAEQPAAARPAKSAAKGAWVDWAVAQGADRAEAEKATKDDLIAAFGVDPLGDDDPDDPKQDDDQTTTGDGGEG